MGGDEEEQESPMKGDDVEDQQQMQDGAMGEEGEESPGM